MRWLMTTSSQEPTSTGRTLAGHDAFVTVDLAVGVAGLPMEVRRTYDSFDKANGDFGIGWNVELSGHDGRTGSAG